MASFLSRALVDGGVAPDPVACMYLCREFRPILPSDDEYKRTWEVLQKELKANELFSKLGRKGRGATATSTSTLINGFEEDMRFMRAEKLGGDSVIVVKLLVTRVC